MNNSICLERVLFYPLQTKEFSRIKKLWDTIHSLNSIPFSLSTCLLPKPIYHLFLQLKTNNFRSPKVQTSKVFQWLKAYSGRVNRLSISIMKWNIFKRLITFHISFLVQSCQYSQNIYLNGLLNLLVNNIIWVVSI